MILVHTHNEPIFLNVNDFLYIYFHIAFLLYKRKYGSLGFIFPKFEMCLQLVLVSRPLSSA